MYRSSSFYVRPNFYVTPATAHQWLNLVGEDLRLVKHVRMDMNANW